MSSPVTYECVQNVALVTISNPPVNALSHATRKGLLECVRRFENDNDAQILIVVGDGKLFLGGADIAEFDRPQQAPFLPDVILELENCTKPVVAVMHGTALGGGLEVAMGAHYRIAHEQTTLGMPEVKIGLMPGAGGTQRLPRLVGVDNAIRMITGGQPVSAEEALAMGLVDHVFQEDDIRLAGAAFARQVLIGTSSVTAQRSSVRTQIAHPLIRRTGDYAVEDVPAGLLADWRSKLSDASCWEVAPLSALQAIESCRQVEFRAGLKEELRLFTELMATPQCSGLIHAFFAERKVSKIADFAGVKGKTIAHIGIVGGGAMGSGLASAALLGGFTVTLIERDLQSANRSRRTIESHLDGAVRCGRLDVKLRSNMEEHKLVTGMHYKTLEEADLIIEAVVEDLDVKKTVFQAIDAAAGPGAILASVSSYLDINELAAFTRRPQSVLGLHFPSPSHVAMLVEVVVAEKTTPELIATGFTFAKKLGKIAVRAEASEGFIGNRLLGHYRIAADHMVLDGASPYQVDKAITDFGFAMGPYAMADLAGLDIGYARRQSRVAIRHPRERHPGWVDDLYHEGRLGRKSGKGYYLYSDKNEPGVADLYIEELVARARHEAGITPRAFSDEEIVTRYLSAMINEAARVLEEGVALRPLDIDAVLMFGYGYPRWKGGPLHTADQLGLPAVLRNIQLFAREDDFFWQSAPLLEQLIEQGRDFNRLNKEFTQRRQIM